MTVLYVMSGGQVDPKARKFIADHRLAPFEFLVDDDHRLIDQFGIFNNHPDNPIEKGVPHPTTYVLDLAPPGSAFYGRQNQLDVGVRKIFRIQKYQFSAQADVFNVLNVSYVKSQNVTLGSSFGQPLDVLQPRLLRLAMQMRF